MLMRFVGALVVIAAATLVYVAVDGLSRGDEMARTLAMFAESNADPFDANDWRWRWRLSSGLLLILGMVGIVAGIGMVMRRRWALLLWCSLVTVLLVGQALTSVAGIAKYAFERTGWVEMGATAALAAASWIAAWTTRTRSRTTPGPLDSLNRQA
jgi:uncharacterized membrane protein YfcA